jgi:hypothetical protein
VKICYCCSKWDILLLQNFKNVAEASLDVDSKNANCVTYTSGTYVIYYGINNVLGKSVESVLSCLNNTAYCKELFSPEMEISRFFLCIVNILLNYNKILSGVFLLILSTGKLN